MTQPASPAFDRSFDNRVAGLVNGMIGVIIFSGSLPATRLAVAGFDPFFLTFARGTIAGVLSLARFASK